MKFDLFVSELHWPQNICLTQTNRDFSKVVKSCYDILKRIIPLKQRRNSLRGKKVKKKKTKLLSYLSRGN